MTSILATKTTVIQLPLRLSIICCLVEGVEENRQSHLCGTHACGRTFNDFSFSAKRTQVGLILARKDVNFVIGMLRHDNLT